MRDSLLNVVVLVSVKKWLEFLALTSLRNRRQEFKRRSLRTVWLIFRWHSLKLRHTTNQVSFQATLSSMLQTPSMSWSTQLLSLVGVLKKTSNIGSYKTPTVSNMEQMGFSRFTGVMISSIQNPLALGLLLRCCSPSSSGKLRKARAPRLARGQRDPVLDTW